MLILRIINKYRRLFTSHQKLRIMELFILMVIGGLFETLSVGLVIPFIDAVVNIDTIMDKEYVKVICRILDLHYPFTFLFVAGTSLGLLYIIKNIYLILEYRIQYRFTYNSMSSTQIMILKNVLSQPYEYFLSVDSNEVIRLINTDVQYTYVMLINLLGAFTEGIVSVMLIGVVLSVVPTVTIGLFLLFAILIVMIRKVSKRILTKYGYEVQKAQANMNRWITQSIGGIREIKVMNVEKVFFDSFSENSKKAAHCNGINLLLSIAPKFIIESICMAIIFFSVSFMIINGERFNDVAPILSAVVIVAIRLLPAFSRISNSITQMTFYEPMLNKTLEYFENNGEDDRISSQIQEGGHNGADLKTSEEILELEGVYYRYPNSGEYVLADANLSVKRGEIIGIIGESGAGKSTLVSLILGLIRPQKGRIMAGGATIDTISDEWHAAIGYVPQTIFLLNGSIIENVVFGRDNSDDDAVRRALHEACLDSYVSKLPRGIDTQIGENGIRLSGGQRQRLGIARALYNEPDVLILDEATSALDNDTERDIMEMIHSLQSDKTIIIIAHRLSTIEACDHVYRITGGKAVKER